MQLQKRVSLTLIPIITILVISLSIAIWSFIFDQTRKYEIERTRLSIEITLVDIRQRATELSSALNKAAEYHEIFSSLLNAREDYSEFAQSRSFVEFDYLLSSQIPQIEEIILLDSELEILALSHANELLSDNSYEPGLDNETREALNALNNYLRSRFLTQGVISFKHNGEFQLLAARVFSQHSGENPKPAGTNERFIVAVTADAMETQLLENVNAFEIRPNGAISLEDITSTPILVSQAESEHGAFLFSDSALFYVANHISDKQIVSQMSRFTFILILIALTLIISLFLVVLHIVNRQILTPINRLEKKVSHSMKTGVVDLQPNAERNEVEVLGNRYLELMNQISRLANMDTLTKLPNRDQFLTSASTIMKHRPDDKYVIYYLDLDRFKQVNDFYGHDEGDQLLKIFAKELQSVVEENLQNPAERTALISRLTGDEFAVFVNTDLLKSDITNTAEHMVRHLARDFETRQGSLHLEVSMGVACYPEHATDAESLLTCADEAMFEAKSRGRNRWQILNQRIVEKNDFKKSTQEAIEEALKNDQMYLVFQPIFETHSRQPVAAEVLLRSTHPVLMEIGTQSYINIAEQSGTIRRIDSLVASIAMQKLAEIRKDLPEFSFSINCSAAELITTDYAESIAKETALAGLPADALEIEITETQLTEFGIQALETLEKLHNSGFKVSLDDFGTGYNSFAQLNSSYVNRLKIDKRFISAINKESHDAKMVNIILGTADLYGLETVAEGVETEEQLGYIQAHGCNYFQGYLLARPMIWDDFRNFLEAHK